MAGWVIHHGKAAAPGLLLGRAVKMKAIATIATDVVTDRFFTTCVELMAEFQKSLRNNADSADRQVNLGWRALEREPLIFGV